MLVVLMGVSGSGKSTIGRLLADRLGWPFLEADEFHPQANRDKLAAGTALTDADRQPWLNALHDGVHAAVNRHGSVVLACSALKEAYRELLETGLENVRWVHLVADAALLADRLERRVGHFSSARILPSQLATLEAPADAVEVQVDQTPAGVVERVARALGQSEVDPAVSDRIIARQLYAASTQPGEAEERLETWLHGGAFSLERIVSRGQATPEDQWYDQPRAEWVALLTGRAGLRFERDQNAYDVAPGDAWLIPAHCRHRVTWTDPEVETVWLALHFKAASSSGD